MFREVKANAKKALKGNMLKIWGLLLIVSLFGAVVDFIPRLFGLETVKTIELFGETITYKSIGLFNTIGAYVILAMDIICAYYILNIIRNKKVTYNDCFDFINKHFLQIMIVSFLMQLFETLGFICLIIPGIIITLGFAFVDCVLIDNPDLKPIGILKKCWNLMKGYKLQFFGFEFSFILWMFACVLIIPIIYVFPYVVVANVCFYEYLVKQQ